MGILVRKHVFLSRLTLAERSLIPPTLSFSSISSKKLLVYHCSSRFRIKSQPAIECESRKLIVTSCFRYCPVLHFFNIFFLAETLQSVIPIHRTHLSLPISVMHMDIFATYVVQTQLHSFAQFCL